MNVLLVNPINRSYVVMPSLGLGYLAAVARRAGHSVTILNCLKEQMTYGDFDRYIRERTFDVIGFQVFSYDLNSVKRHLALIKAASPRTVTVAGGAHPSGDPEGTLRYLADLDYAFQGEAEAGFPLFLDRLQAGSSDIGDVPGLARREGEAVRVNPTCHIEDLNSLPTPAWDLHAPETYPEAPHGAFTKQFPTAPIIITRGCPFRCTFCAGKTITGPKVRKRSIDNVMQELRELRSRGIMEFHIEDENFTAHRPLVLEFCERLRQEGLGMTWSLPSGVRIDSLELNMIREMEKAGCYSLALGIEFGTQRIMDLTKKRLSPELVRTKLQLFKGVRIKTTGFFLFGIPGETLDDMRQTARFARELPIDRAQFNNFMPLPGSELWDTLKAEGRIDAIDWDKFFVHDVAYADPDVRVEDIKKIQRSAYLRFYLRPRIILNILAEIKSFHHFRFLMKRFFDALR
jgi:anaerobic magnesium-protoporphyrin IX monomethyl ester cyclase